MRSIYKYSLLNPYTKIEGCIEKFLDIQMQNGVPVIWAIVDTELRDKKFYIYCYGTGWELNDGEELEDYLGTVQDNEGYVWHYFLEEVYEKKK